ncbi:MAG: DNA-binding protein [Thermoplasmata archaeon]|nr:DNA-binding protein [Thermoplasmata archaeon]
MQGKEEQRTIILKLDDGEELFESLRNAIQKFNIKSGFVQAGIGMLKDIEIGYFDGHKYHTKHLEKPHELVSLQGSISTKDEIIIHLHCSLAGENHELIGGHLISGKVCIVNEILIKKFENVLLGRVLNPSTGLKELTVE